MDRRNFLSGVVGAAVGWVASGRGPTGGPAGPRAYMHPVPFINEAEASSLSALFQVLPATAAQQAATYPQSVAAGDPNPNGAVIWTRVSPSVVTSPTSATVGWQIATDAAFTNVVVQGAALVQSARDNTVKLAVQNAALTPFTIYYYRFIFLGIPSRTGRFKTMPMPGDTVNLLKIGYVVCQDYSNGYYNAYGLLAQEDVDVVVHLGDYIYEYLSDGVGGPGGGSVRVVPPYPSGQQTPQNLADYRHLYQVYRSDLQQQAMHERFAMILLWDDHEFMNDCHQDFHEDTPNPGESATTPKPLLRQAANQAWWEHGLAAVPFNAQADWSTSIQVYRKFSFGTLLDLIVTDERLYRDGPPCGDVDIGERYQTYGCAELADPARTMLGATQKAWFLDAVTGSTATWKVWANEVMLCQYLLPTGTNPSQPVQFFDLDQWDGYPVERAEILGAIQSAGVENFVVLSGDAHLYLASYLYPDFNAAAEAAAAGTPLTPVGVELMVGAISSGNYLDAAVDGPTQVLKSITPAAAAMAGLGIGTDYLSSTVSYINPHIQFWNGSTWGYAILTITPQSLLCEFRVVSTVKSTPATLQHLAAFQVPAGQALLTPY